LRQGRNRSTLDRVKTSGTERLGTNPGTRRQPSPVLFPVSGPARRLPLMALLVCSLVAHATTGAEAPAAAVNTAPPRGKGSDQTCRVRWLPGAKIVLDGRADEPAWAQAAVEKHFVFPWKPEPAPATEFRALCDGTNFYFSFRVEDADIVVLDRLRDKVDAIFEDRVEIYLCRDELMNDYYCFEVDSRGRAFDYHASFYRNLDRTWSFPGLETKASPLPKGYEVEGRIPLKSLPALGFPEPRPGVKIRCGLYRAEFSHDRSGREVEQKATLHNLGRKIEGPRPIEEWMSWVDPKRAEPDFHVPASLGWLEFVK
jgi:hypothetical protein